MQGKGIIHGRASALRNKRTAGRFCGKPHPNGFPPDSSRPRLDADPSMVDSTAVYLAHMTDELAKLAHGAGLDLLSYLLDMARLEAATCARAGALEFPRRNEV